MISSHDAFSADGVTLYTPYTKITVAPGEAIDYSLDVINNSSEIQNIDLSVTGIPKGWNHFLKSGGINVSRVAVLPGEKQNCTLHVEVPFQVNKGSYNIKVHAGGMRTINLAVIVSEQGTYTTEFTTDQMVMQGRSNSLFTYNTKLKNRTADKQFYGLFAKAPQGWEVSFNVNYKQVTSVETSPNSSTDIMVEINPPDNIKEGRYTIPVTAGTSATSASIDLEVIVSGSYNMELTTPTGVLSGKMTAGKEKKMEILISNTGSSTLKSVSLSAFKPSGWLVGFEPKIIETIEPGKYAVAYVTIKPDRKSIAGDYIVSVESTAGDAKVSTQLRISIKTPVVWGWIGILIMAIAVGSIYYVFRKYGRR
jgi:uncharacterized membrane protein